MYALKPSISSHPPTKRARTVPRAKPQRRHRYRTIAIETSVKLTVNAVLSVAAIAALAQLLPYRTSQTAKLQELQVAVKSTEDRVQHVRANFGQYFDPVQAKVIMQQQTNRIDPQQRQIIFQDVKIQDVKIQDFKGRP